MTRMFAGFYWTLPVNWIGFRRLPEDVGEAAAKSRTIRYQRELCRRHVAIEGGQMVQESAFLDIRPDRPTHALVEAMGRADKQASRLGATLLYVNFEEAQLWRRLPSAMKPHLDRWHGIHPDRDTVTIDDKPFDPVAHFRRWRELEESQRHTRRERATDGLERAIRQIPDGPGRTAQIAKYLNGLQIGSLTGKPWTGENVRKFMKALGL